MHSAAIVRKEVFMVHFISVSVFLADLEQYDELTTAQEQNNRISFRKSRKVFVLILGFIVF